MRLLIHEDAINSRSLLLTQKAAALKVSSLSGRGSIFPPGEIVVGEELVVGNIDDIKMELLTILHRYAVAGPAKSAARRSSSELSIVALRAVHD